ncbi:MAG: hypothetical protein JNK30_18305 [Phenylobacterium sp.]|uniref:hypothetical protein n=1 Tax=Phenylobacterium sp. TaxID=1871053 RepID=UPI001A529AE9|nr:hypothetical protein [Phenylobacterium sp.]MBL8773342.1 hypothetical protein [Phenylobacterium sp.]
MILELLASRLAGPIATALCLVLLMFGVVQCSGRAAAEKRQAAAEAAAATLRVDLDTCRGNEARAHQAAADASASVELVRKEGERLREISRKKLQSARSVAESYRQDAQRILATEVAGDRCEAAARLIEENAE